VIRPWCRKEPTVLDSEEEESQPEGFRPRRVRCPDCGRMLTTHTINLDRLGDL